MRGISLIRLFLVSLGIVWLELTLIPMFSYGAFRMDLFIIFIAFYAFRVGWKELIWVALICGFLKELVSNSFFGLQMASYAGGAFLLQFIASRFDRDDRWIQLAGLLSFAWLVLILYVTLGLLIGLFDSFNGSVGLESILIALYTTLVGFFIFPLLEKWLRPQLKVRQYELF